jgi:hypothetical protein
MRSCKSKQAKSQDHFYAAYCGFLRSIKWDVVHSQILYGEFQRGSAILMNIEGKRSEDKFRRIYGLQN